MAARKRSNASAGALANLREFGLRYPGAHLKSPWPGHLDLAVKDKTFAYLSVEGEPFKISCKLPHSNALALSLPFTEATRYGLGKSGWVTAAVPEGEDIPLPIFKAWIDESYRAVAPKKLVAALPSADEEQTRSAKTPSAKTRSAKTRSAKTRSAKTRPAKETQSAKPRSARKTRPAKKRAAR